jgi:hypothetical protein
MKKMTLSALALLGMTASALMLRGGSIQSAAALELATNAAYRDGLYLGKLAAEQGSNVHVSAGRWARANDRAAFAAGYEHAYTIANRSADAGGQQ